MLFLLLFVSLINCAYQIEPGIILEISQPGLNSLASTVAIALHQSLNGFNSSGLLVKRETFAVRGLQIPKFSMPSVKLTFVKGLGIDIDIAIDTVQVFVAFNTTYMISGRINAELSGTRLRVVAVPVMLRKNHTMSLVLHNCDMRVDDVDLRSSSKVVNLWNKLTRRSKQTSLIEKKVCETIYGLWLRSLMRRFFMGIDYTVRLDSASNEFLNFTGLTMDLSMTNRPFVGANYTACFAAGRFFYSGSTFYSSQLQTKPIHMDPRFDRMARFIISSSVFQQFLAEWKIHELFHSRVVITNDDIPSTLGKWFRWLTCAGCQLIVDTVLSEIPVFEIRRGFVEVNATLSVSIFHVSGDNNSDKWATISAKGCLEIIPVLKNNFLKLMTRLRDRVNVRVNWTGSEVWAQSFKLYATKFGFSTLEDFATEQLENLFGKPGEFLFDTDKNQISIKDIGGVRLFRTSLKLHPDPSPGSYVTVDTDFDARSKTQVLAIGSGRRVVAILKAAMRNVKVKPFLLQRIGKNHALLIHH